MIIKKEPIAGWGNFPWIYSQTISYPNIQSLTQLIESPQSTIARGLGRSYADQAINPNGITACILSLNKFIDFDEINGILTCESGTSLNDIIFFLAPKGWFPMICPGTKHVTIGGAIANDIHGKAHHVDGSFVNSIISFDILLADGNIVTASRENNEELFWANFGGLGLLGIIVSAKMKLRKITTTYFKQKAIKASNLDHLLDEIDIADSTYQYSVAWVDSMARGKNLGSGVLTLGNPALLEELPPNLLSNPLQTHRKQPISLPIYFPEIALNTFTVKLLNTVIGYTQANASLFCHYEKFFFPLDSIGDWNKGYGKRGFIQYQFVIPELEARKNIRKILETIANGNCVPFLNVLKKFGEGQGVLSFPFKGYTFAIDFPVTKDLAQLTKKLDALVLDCGGRIYLGKDAMLDFKTFEAMYPQHSYWKSIKQRYDPLNKFQSAIGCRLNLC